jgi:hypothetical protein
MDALKKFTDIATTGLTDALFLANEAEKNNPSRVQPLRAVERKDLQLRLLT